MEYALTHKGIDNHRTEIGRKTCILLSSHVVLNFQTDFTWPRKHRKNTHIALHNGLRC